MVLFLKSRQFRFSSINSPTLTRNFIYDRLYNKSGGYFCKNDIQIGELKKQINFKEMIGFQDYQQFLSENYPKNAWLTPSELFKPWYGFSIANYIYTTIKRKKLDPSIDKIKIIEIGAGAGSVMESILKFFNNYDQLFYHNLEYGIIEISPQMCQCAENKLLIENKTHFEKKKIRIKNDDFLNYTNSNEGKKENVFLIFLEVLDNMPHDRVYFSDEHKDWFYETKVEFDENDSNFKEIKLPISDPLIKQMLEIYKKKPENLDTLDQQKYEKGLVNKFIKLFLNNPKKNTSLFLPTFCLKAFKHIQNEFPNHNLIISDFDMLKTNKTALEGINAPIVSKKLEKSHEKIDFDNYLVKRGEADIFFPTDFLLLSVMYQEIFKKKSVFMKTHRFIDEFSKEKWAETRSGYNPLKEDFMNTSFFFNY